MTAFTLDTSGSIHFATPYAKAHGLKTFYRWPDLSPFEQGYVEALFASWLAAMEALPLAEELAWPDFEEHPEDWPWPWVFADRDGDRWDIVRLNGEPRRVETGTPLCKDAWGFSDLSPETVAAIRKDCDMARLILGRRMDSYSSGQWLWTTRNNDPRMAQSGFLPLTPFLDDEGKVRLRETGK